MNYLLWDEGIMLKSYEFLKQLQAVGIDFILIGGWAVYLLTKYHMSRDIDLMVQDREEWKLRNYILAQGGEEKSSGLKKTGFALGEVELDVYTESKSDLSVSVKDVFSRKLFVDVEGTKVLRPEQLLPLKLAAAEARQHSVKGLKDRCDILALCLNASIDYSKLSAGSIQSLRNVVSMCGKEYDYVLHKELSPREVKLLKKKLLAKLSGRSRSA